MWSAALLPREDGVLPGATDTDFRFICLSGLAGLEANVIETLPRRRLKLGFDIFRAKSGLKAA